MKHKIMNERTESKWCCYCGAYMDLLISLSNNGIYKCIEFKMHGSTYIWQKYDGIGLLDCL